MNAIKTAALGLLMAAVAGGAFAQPPGDQRMPVKPAMPMSMADKDKMMSCMAMAPSAMKKAPDCMAMMKTMKMTDADMTKMMACKKMSAAMMMKDKKCMAMKDMHPDMMMMPMASMPMKK